MTDAASSPIPSPFAYPAYRAFFVAKLGSTLAQMLMVVVIGWQVYDLARATMPMREAAFLLGLIGLAQFLPVFALSLVVGVIADRMDRRVIARVAVGLELLCAVVLASLAFAGSTLLWPLFAVALALGVARAFAAPSLSALAPNLVPPAVLPTAIAWNSIGWQAGAVLGPVIGGLAYDLAHPAPYSLAAVLLLASLVALFLIPKVPQRASSSGSGVESVKEGLRYVRGNPIVFGAISLDMFAVILGGATAMLPIFARDILMVGPDGLGLLRAAPAAGAALVALWLTRWPLKNNVGVKMFFNVGLFAVATVVFGLSSMLWLSIASLVVLGGADMVSVYVRSSLIQLHTPDDMRGRVSSVSLLFISASNELGEFRAGMMAGALGAVEATVLGGLLALGVTVLWARLFPELRDADRLDLPEEMLARDRKTEALTPPN
ncbi:MFS transporter [Sandaracinobacteroides hominis]|uniref:MFS transporter n=1 Tax=Sandaracinobacteroides hominis TaxID=2780086 RepID=UPI002E2E3930|nr:MFS transporter [Sandaracinobacteroides hominis]